MLPPFGNTCKAMLTSDKAVPETNNTKIEPISLTAECVRRSGSETYGALLLPHVQMLKKWISHRVPKGIECDDVTQQTLLLALRHMDSFRFEASVPTWLCSIALNVIRLRLRRSDYSRLVFEDASKLKGLRLADSGQLPLDALERRETFFRLHCAIERLPEPYRIVVELRDLGGLSIKETMSKLSISKAAVKSRHHRARCMLHQFLVAPEKKLDIRYALRLGEDSTRA